MKEQVTRVYGSDGEWLEISEDSVIIGFCERTLDQIGNVERIELPEVGKEVVQGEALVLLESGKAAYEYVSPVSGRIYAVNQDLSASLDLLQNFPESKGWIICLNNVSEEDRRRLIHETELRQ